MRATYSASSCGTHHIFLRHGLRSFSPRRRRTVSRDRLSCPVSFTISSASSSSVQRARPAGGFEQAVATSRASSLPVSLRSAPGRGCSFSACSRLPSTNRCLVRYTVEPPTRTLAAIWSSFTPASAASRICARLTFRDVRLPPLRRAPSSIALVLGQGHAIAYIHGCLRVGGAVESTDESNVWRKTGLHRYPGTVSRLYRRLHARQSAAARRSRPSAVSASLHPPSIR